MGPQLYRCGNSRSSVRPTMQRNCFNGAATLSLRKCQIRTMNKHIRPTLQWGRNFIVAEMSDPHHEQAHPAYASMGPQLYRCGNGVVPRYGDRSTEASMGPQLYRCGNSETTLYTLLDGLLQWGRNFIVAETPSPVSSLNSSPRFNGAATLSLRKRLNRFNLVCLRRASMGPQLYRCGNTPRGGTRQGKRACFNGAATLSLRKRRSAGVDTEISACFNGAATLSLRKPFSDGITKPVCLHASMGPQLYRCRNPERRNLDMLESSSLQWGRNFIVAETTATPQWRIRSMLCFNGAATLSLRKQVFRPLACTVTYQLQWGRNFIVAETQDSTPIPFSASVLQWGRNFIVAETLTATFQASFDLVRFNGAATLSLRKRDKEALGIAIATESFNGAATLSLRKL